LKSTAPTLHGVLASIPSPDSSNLGPFHMYGALLAVGVVVAVLVAEQRWRRRGYGSPGVADVSFWVVVWGVIGARAYHVITDYQRFDDDPLRAFQIWKGGLSIWGAVIAGAIAVVVVTRRRHMPTLVVMDCMAPGIVLAQAIGRWGNWFNQELFGRPTTLPWGLEISIEHRPLGYQQYTTFHPTFLYESLSCLAIVGLLLLAEKRLPLKHGQTFALYVILYTFGRFWFENLRIDPAHDVGPLRVNAWVSVGVFLFGLWWFWWLGRHEPRQRRPGATGDEASEIERTETLRHSGGRGGRPGSRSGVDHEIG
jgi:prolipoprotein diacylglyceryl transferase